MSDAARRRPASGRPTVGDEPSRGGRTVRLRTPSTAVTSRCAGPASSREHVSVLATGRVRGVRMTAVRPLGPEQRARAWAELAENQFEVLVVGGGVTGAGVALDAATRGLRTALVEARDFASGTSSRSSKLFHGGLRYLEQFDFGLVREALHERDLSVTRLAHSPRHRRRRLACVAPPPSPPTRGGGRPGGGGLLFPFPPSSPWSGRCRR